MTTIYTFSMGQIEKAKLAGRYSTAGLYKSALNSFLGFTADPNFTFKALTPQLIKEYEEQLLRLGKSHNTISAYMRMLRAISNQATDQGISFGYPINELFDFVFTGYEPTVKRAIAPSIIRRLSLLDLDLQPGLSFSRDLFLLSFYLRGIPFVDLVYLRKSDIKHNNIYYYRRKTNQQLSVYIEPCASQIINKYKAKEKNSPYLLPLLTQVGKEGYAQYKSALRLYNQHLHKISKILSLSTPLTSYVARHSWATTAKDEGVSISIISESLGHNSEKITHVYLASFSSNIMSKANRKVINTVLTQKKGEKRNKKKSKH